RHAQIEDLRVGAVLFLQDVYLLRGDNFSHRVFRIAQVADPSCSERAGIHTGAGHPLCQAVIAEVALLGHLVYRMEEADTVGAPHDTVAAADAPFPVHEYDTV